MTPRQREARIRATREPEGRERRLVAVGLVLLGLVVVAAFAFLTGRATAAREAENDAARALEPPPPDPWARPKAVLPAASGALAEAPEPAAALSAEAPEPAPVASATAYRREEWPQPMDEPQYVARAGARQMQIFQNKPLPSLRRTQ